MLVSHWWTMKLCVWIGLLCSFSTHDMRCDRIEFICVVCVVSWWTFLRHFYFLSLNPTSHWRLLLESNTIRSRRSYPSTNLEKKNIKMCVIDRASWLCTRLRATHQTNLSNSYRNYGVFHWDIESKYLFLPFCHNPGGSWNSPYWGTSQ